MSQQQRKLMNRAVIESHKRLLRECENHKDEITDITELAIRYPQKSREELERLQRLNQKINSANEYLYQEQYYFLNPSERQPIDYNEELWAIDEDEPPSEEYEEIRQELYKED